MNLFGRFLERYRPEFGEEQIIYELSENPILLHTYRCRSPLSISISSKYSLLAAGSSDGNIYTINESGFPIWSYPTGGYVWGVSVSSDGSLIAAGSSDGNLYLLNSQGELLWDCDIGAIAYSVSMSSYGSYIAVSADDLGIYLFNYEGELLWNKNMDAVRGISLSSDGTYITAVQAIKGWKEKISLYKNEYKDENESEPPQKWTHKTEDYMWGVALSPDSSYLAAGSSDGNIYFFSSNGKLLWTYQTGGYVWGVSVSSHGKLIAAGSSDGHIYLLNIKGDLLWNYKTSGDVMDVSVASDGSYLAAASLYGDVYLFSIPFY